MSGLASGLHRLRRSSAPWEVLWSALASCGLVLFSQLTVAMVPRLFPSLSLLAMLPIAGLVFLAAIVLGRLWRRFIGVAASAPLFVLFNILLMWGVYVFVIRRDTTSLLDMLINAECALLLWGLYRILSGDPGIVSCDSSYLEEAGCMDFVEAIYSSEKLPTLSRIRQCNCCKANVRGYDHHCPAFGTCIGQKNHRLFMALLTGFVVAESTYTMCSTKYITRCINSGTIRSENPVSLNIVISTMLFSILQVLWQIVLLMWHIYCICFNIKRDEWVMSNFPCFGLFLHQLQVFSFAVSCS
ncbi:palmitoyltransferase akr1-like isoform X1 [Phragmites australis]|uniref:palmitoyltransferase akr1-like isoform X1 n=1 Tax=Phragmites australis TaxID=29695 RepID=UPI002D7815F2|nr:palmitoyltransferase akr1-like isoform X1 [Phragmites australis]